MTPSLLIPVEMIGFHWEPCFVDFAGGTGGFRWVKIFHYPQSPQGQQLKDARRSGGLTLRAAAAAAGLSAAEYSGLELGKLTLEDEDWPAVIEAILRVKSEGGTMKDEFGRSGR